MQREKVGKQVGRPKGAYMPKEHNKTGKKYMIEDYLGKDFD